MLVVWLMTYIRFMCIYIMLMLLLFAIICRPILSTNLLSQFSLSVAGLRAPLSRFREVSLYAFLGSISRAYVLVCISARLCLLFCFCSVWDFLIGLFCILLLICLKVQGINILKSCKIQRSCSFLIKMLRCLHLEYFTTLPAIFCWPTALF